jgi:histidinol-phosphate/aromatic aminotransferase/cobyric acid decarboxylase-like protein/choline kinase
MTTPGPDLQAIILAAGIGRRMRPLSDRSHKALLPVGDTTILGRIMDALGQVGVRRVTIVTGYRAPDIEEFLRTGYPDADLRFVYNSRFAETNNVVSLSLALSELDFDMDILLIECDLIFDAGVLARLISCPARNVALLDNYRTGMDGTVVEVQGSFITAVHPASMQDADFSYDGKFKTLNIYRFAAEFARDTLRPLLHAYADIDASSYYEMVLGMLTNIAAYRISAELVADESWTEVDTPSDLAAARFEFMPASRPAILTRSFGGHWNFPGLLDFSLMKNAYFPPGAMLAAMRHALPDLVTTYGSRQVVLNEKLSYFLHCDPDRVQVLHGASQAFPFLPRVLGSRRAAIPAPTFGEYDRAWPNATRYADAPGIDWACVESLAGEHELMVLVNPNSTTGTTTPTKDIYALARRLPGTLFLVDESFLPFSGEPSLVDILEDEPLPNVVVLASLSKSLGMHGLRLGYLYSCDRQVNQDIGAELPIWNLSAEAEFVLEMLIKFVPAYEASLTATARDRDEFRAQLRDLSLVSEVYPSGGNFLLARLDDADPKLASRIRNWLLCTERIEIKDVTDRFPDRLPRLRLAVRHPTDNARLIAALAGIPATVLELRQ